MNKVINSCVYLSAGVYVLFSLISYANFGQIVQGNVFKNCILPIRAKAASLIPSSLSQ